MLLRSYDLACSICRSHTCMMAAQIDVIDVLLAEMFRGLHINVQQRRANVHRPADDQGPFLRFLGHLLHQLERACDIIRQILAVR